MVFQVRCFVVAGSITYSALKCRTFCQEHVLQDRWSLITDLSRHIAQYSQDTWHTCAMVILSEVMQVRDCQDSVHDLQRVVFYCISLS